VSAVERHLFDGENAVLCSRMHLRALGAPLAAFLLAATLGLGAATVAADSSAGEALRIGGVAIATVAALRLGWAALGWKRRWVALTTTRLLETSGVMRARARSTPLRSISDVACRRSLAGRILGYGDIVVRTAAGMHSIGPVPAPRRLAQAVSALRRPGRARPDPAPHDATLEETPAHARPSPGTMSGGHEVLGHGAPPAEGDRLGARYLVTELLAAGGMGNVFRGIDERLEREVAIKTLRAGLATEARALERFRREALAAATLSHPNIASIFDYGEQGGAPFIVMELVRGTDLAEILAREGILTPKRATRLALETLEALQHAHECGLIHRDVKPGNVVVCGADRVKVTDFGIARAAGASELTDTGMVLGSAHYMSPEQVQGGSVTFSSDIYAMGIVLYEMLVGAPPFAGASPVKVAQRHVQGDMPRPSRANPRLGRAWDTVVARATAADPGRRYPSARAMASALENVLETGKLPKDVDGPSSAPRRRVQRRHRFDTPPLRT
jgi:hypothetical protein